MKTSLVINSEAGSLQGKDPHQLADRICSTFQKVGHRCQPHVGPGSTLAESLKDAARNVDLLIIGGGDGTVVAAANAAIKEGIVLGVLPLGTVNQLAKNLNIPVELESAIAVLTEGQMKQIDVGVVNGQIFLIAVVLGVFVDVVKKREEMRSEMGPLKWPALLVEMSKEVLNAEPMVLSMNTGWKKKRLRTCAVVIANNEFDDTVSLVPKRASLDKGELSVLIAESQSGWGFLNLMARLSLGTTRNDPKLVRMALKELQISSVGREIHASVDGEVYELLSPLHFSIKPGALKIIIAKDGN